MAGVHAMLVGSAGKAPPGHYFATNNASFLIPSGVTEVTIVAGGAGGGGGGTGVGATNGSAGGATSVSYGGSTILSATGGLGGGFGDNSIGVNGGSGGIGYGGGFGGMDFALGDIFGSIFGNGFGGFGGSGRANPNAPQRGSDTQASVTISFEEAAKGCPRSIDTMRIETCDECKGSGCQSGHSPKTCPECNGRGQVTVQQRTPFGVIQSAKLCTRCNGRGTIIENPCKKCNGAGRVRKSAKLDINIPAGVDDRQILTVRGQGNKGVNGGPSADLNIVVNVRPHPIFERDGYNVWCDVHLTFMQVTLGCTIQVPTLDGKVEYTVPAGTQPGDVFKLRGRGIQSRSGMGKGDQLVRIIVDIPKKLTQKQEELIKQLALEFNIDNLNEDKKGFFGKKKN